MIVYLFNNKFFETISLPVLISGEYPIYVGGHFVANISSNAQNKWEVHIYGGLTSKELEQDNNILAVYKPYFIVGASSEESFNLIATPKYDENVQEYKINSSFTIGSNDSCDICYNPKRSENGTEILKLNQSGEGVWLIECNSPNFFISGARAVSGTKVYSGDYIYFWGLKVIIFGNKLIINHPSDTLKLKPIIALDTEKAPVFDLPKNVLSQSVSDAPLFTREDYFFKSPRFNFAIEEAEVLIDEPPKPETPSDVPLMLTIGPQLTMVCTSILSLMNFLQSFLTGSTNITRFIITLATTGVTITSTLLWPTLTRKFNKKSLIAKEEKRQNKYTEYLTRKHHEIALIKDNQKQTIIYNYPSAAQCEQIIKGKTKELWQRSIEHEDFLSIRLGIGNLSAKIKIDAPKESFSLADEDALFMKLRQIVEDSHTIMDAPVSYRFTDQSVNAVVGSPVLIKEFMDCIFLQMMTFHAYTDLKIVTFTKEPEKWDYLKVIPHSWNNQKTMRYFASTVEELIVIAAELEKTYDARVANSEEEALEDDGKEHETKKADFNDFRPYYLFFIDDVTAVRNVSLINKILHYKRNMGFSLIISSQNISSLPSETQDLIVIGENESAIMSSKLTNNQQKFKADLNHLGEIDIYNCAQRLANIPINVEKAKYELPSSLSFLALYNVGKVEQLNSLARWSDNNPVLSLSVPIGIDQNGEIFRMDIHEKAYGPHGLVAGTTGSGKSEWIVTYILSLAVNFSPDEVQFVLIDYKGGGLALSFENSELGVKLPHLAGTITNLDKSEIFRSIAAIESELKRRQSIFNEAREKLKEGSMNIYKYQQYYRKGLVDEPLSHLLIICDEFAELKQQQSEFMDQLISTSRIGRSLGIHLILATQKPSGVVNEQIWSNSKFKVCLKVQDKSDSNEILKKPDAAFLKQTGSFYLQVGNDDYYNLGQSAWAGAKYYPSEVIKRKVDDSIQYIDNIGRVIGFYEEEVQEAKESKGEELLNVVAYISDISKQITLKGKSLWLPNVPSQVYLSDLFKKYNKVGATPYTYNIAIGEYDEPRKQKQGLLEVNLASGNIAIIGQNGSGIDYLISTIIWSSLIEHTPYELAYYIIDFGAETLKKFAKFPQVGEVVFQDDMDKVVGVLELVMDEIERRKEILSNYNGSFEFYNKVNEKNKMPLIIMVINSFDIFCETVPKLNDIITNLFRDAPKYGVIFIVSVNAPNALRQRQLQFFNHIIVMQLNDDAQYRSITNCRRGLIPKKTLGRGICKTDELDSESYCEFQTAFIAPEEKELDLIKSYADSCVNYYKCKVKQLAKIPEDVTSEDLNKYITTLEEVPLGYSFYEKEIAKYNFLSEKIHLITGKNIKDNLPFIYGLTSVLSKMPNVKIRVLDMMDIFKKPILDIKLFNDQIDNVFGALEKDAFKRTETEPVAINIILGIGDFKRKLSQGGLEIFRNLFNNINKSKNSIYILIDNYDKLRTLKLESWFTSVNTNNGIWLGVGAANQSLINTGEITPEDKKYDFNGLAFLVESGKYKVIKTVMDGDE